MIKPLFPLGVNSSGSHFFSPWEDFALKSVQYPVFAPFISSSDQSGNFFGQISGVFSEDDYASDTSTSGELTAGADPLSGNIELEIDHDWFRFNAEQDKYYTITVAASDISNLSLGLYDADGRAVSLEFVIDGDVQSGRIQLKFAAPDTALFFVSVEDSFFGLPEDPPFEAYSYTIDLQSEDIIGELPGDNSSAGMLPANGTEIFSRIDFSEDTDWFEFQTVAGQLTVISLTSDFYLGMSLTLYDQNGDFAELGGVTTTSHDDNRVDLTFTPQVSANFFVEVYGSNPALYGLQISGFTDDFPDDNTTSAHVSAGMPVQGELEVAGDADWIGFSLTDGAPTTLLIEMANLNALAFNIHNADGTFSEINYSEEFSANGRLVIFDAPVTGEYFIAVSGETGAYSVSQQELDDDFAGSILTNGQITPESAAQGQIQYNADRDWFAFDASAGDGIIFRLTAANTDGLILSLFDASGNAFGVTGDLELGNDGVLLSSHFAAAGTYYIEVTSQFSSNVDLTAYSLNMEQVVDDYRADTMTAGLIAPDQSVMGVAEITGDRDWFAFEAVAGQSYYFDVTAEQRLSFSVDIFDSAGNLVVDGGTDGIYQDVLFHASQSGTYYAEVFSGEFGTTSGMQYSLTRLDIQDEHAGDISTTGEISFSMNAAGYIHEESDRDWFRFEANQGDVFALREVLELASFTFNLYDSEGNFQLSYTDNPIEVLVSGTYYLEVESPFGELGAPARYEIDLFDPAAPGEGAYFVGGDGDEARTGTSANDRFFLGEGADQMTGGGGSDIFMFGAGSGDDVITDFQVGIDFIEMLDSVFSFSQLVVWQEGFDTFIKTENGRITLLGVDADQMSGDSFIFRLGMQSDGQQGLIARSDLAMPTVVAELSQISAPDLRADWQGMSEAAYAVYEWTLIQDG